MPISNHLIVKTYQWKIFSIWKITQFSISLNYVRQQEVNRFVISYYKDIGFSGMYTVSFR